MATGVDLDFGAGTVPAFLQGNVAAGFPIIWGPSLTFSLPGDGTVQVFDAFFGVTWTMTGDGVTNQPLSLAGLGDFNINTLTGVLPSGSGAIEVEIRGNILNNAGGSP